MGHGRSIDRAVSKYLAQSPLRLAAMCGHRKMGFFSQALTRYLEKFRAVCMALAVTQLHAMEGHIECASRSGHIAPIGLARHDGRPLIPIGDVYQNGHQHGPVCQLAWGASAPQPPRPDPGRAPGRPPGRTQAWPRGVGGGLPRPRPPGGEPHKNMHSNEEIDNSDAGCGIPVENKSIWINCQPNRCDVCHFELPAFDT